eukprot:2786511-Prymnesium_polylepis.1
MAKMVVQVAGGVCQVANVAEEMAVEDGLCLAGKMETMGPDNDRCTCRRTCLRNGRMLLKSSTIRLAPSSAGGSQGKRIAESEPPPALPQQARTGAPVTPIDQACDDSSRSRAA